MAGVAIGASASVTEVLQASLDYLSQSSDIPEAKR